MGEIQDDVLLNIKLEMSSAEPPIDIHFKVKTEYNQFYYSAEIPDYLLCVKQPYRPLLKVIFSYSQSLVRFEDKKLSMDLFPSVVIYAREFAGATIDLYNDLLQNFVSDQNELIEILTRWCVDASYTVLTDLFGAIPEYNPGNLLIYLTVDYTAIFDFRKYSTIIHNKTELRECIGREIDFSAVREMSRDIIDRFAFEFYRRSGFLLDLPITFRIVKFWIDAIVEAMFQLKERIGRDIKFGRAT